jgi:hypothetical protein
MIATNLIEQFCSPLERASENGSEIKLCHKWWRHERVKPTKPTIMTSALFQFDGNVKTELENIRYIFRSDKVVSRTVCIQINLKYLKNDHQTLEFS